MYPSVMQRQEEERERGGNGAGQNLGPSYARSPTQTDYPQPAFTQSPIHSRPSYSNSSYPPSAAVPLPLPLSSPTHIARHPTSPLTTTHATYSSEYQSTPRDKLTSNYYDPTSDSSERRPSESAVWYNGHPPPVSKPVFQASEWMKFRLMIFLQLEPRTLQQIQHRD